jgi:nicotinamidase-related amidase
MNLMTENPKRALLVIDVQNEYFTGKLPITYPAGSLANVLSAMDAAREHGVLVIVIQHASPQPNAPVFRKGSQEWELHTEVAARPHDVLIHKSLPAVLPAQNSRHGCASAVWGRLPLSAT